MGFAEDGFATAPGVATPAEVDRLLRAVEQARDELAVRSRGGVYAIRNLLSVVPAVTEWANSAACRELVEPVLGPTAQAVRGILFDKTPEANWKVPWHQDLTIAVRKRAEVAGYGPWTVKAGVPHVQPPVAVLERMLAVRLHLDNCGEENGPVRVVPGSHRARRLRRASASQSHRICRGRTAPRTGVGILEVMTRLAAALLTIGMTAFSAEWSKPVEIVVDDAICATYRARVDSDGNLTVRLTLADGWHTFAMDNQIRANEKLAGKKALGMDKPTSFTVTGGLAVDGPWKQPALLDFSKPELRIFSWGFEKQALFAAKAKRVGGERAARIGIKAQACTPTVCKDISKELELDLSLTPGPAEPGLAVLTPVRTQ